MQLNNFATIFLILNIVALLTVPRRWALTPVLLGACYMTIGQGIELGPFSFTIVRILVAVGFVRVMLRGERMAGGLNWLDWLLILFAIWALLSSLARPNLSSALVFRLGLVFSTCGIYFLARIFLQSFEDVWLLISIIAIVLLPIACEMVHEQIRNYNVFSVLGGVSPIPYIREGRIRAQGPFMHAILAGTVGAVCFPLMVALWHRYRKLAIVGIVSCVVIVVCSSSSGPLASLLLGIGGIFMWFQRRRMKIVRWTAVAGYIFLDIVMKAQPYYLMARVPLVKGSTGWHRAELIDSAIRHFSEWWLWGTDYTRHWMPTGVTWSSDHTDITNHYIKMGVLGGFPMMILFIFTLLKAFSYVGKNIESNKGLSASTLFMLWTLGASLFANAATMISVSYFDQSYIFLYLVLAAIGSTKFKNDELEKDRIVQGN